MSSTTTKNIKKLFISLFALVMLLMMGGVQNVLAARPDSLKDTLSDSRKSTASNHTIVLDLSASTQLIAGETVIVNFPAGFTLTSIAIGDVDFQNGATDETLQSVACGSTDTVRWELSSQTMTFTACNSYSAEAAGTAITIKVGTNASGGSNQITNHATANPYTLTVSGTYGDDSQDTRIVITEPITMSATLDEALTLTVDGVTAANCPDVGTETDRDTDATTIPFGTINTESFYGACQKLTTTTNAGGGYSSTVHTTTRPTSGSYVINEGTCDGACSDSTENAWAIATNNGYGYCMKDDTGNGAQTADAGWGTNYCGASPTYFKTIARADASETGITIMSSASGVSGDSSYIKYQISVDSAQASGTYSTYIVYISTGTF